MNSLVLTKSQLLGLVFLGVLGGGFLATPFDPQAQDFRSAALTGPSWEHWLGVDALGRDFFSRLWRGLSNTALMAGTAMAANLIMATIVLAVMASLPKRFAAALLGLVNLGVAVPIVLVSLLLLLFLAPSSGALVLAAALGNLSLAIRQLRVLWLEQRRAAYAEASLALGASRWELLRHTLWPNLQTSVGALARYLFALGGLELSGLSYLGLHGDPSLPELGALLREGQPHLFGNPRLVLCPGLLLALLLGLAQLANMGLRRPQPSSSSDPATNRNPP